MTGFRREEMVTDMAPSVWCPLSEGDAARLERLIDMRADSLARWLEEHAPRCPSEQRHLDEGTQERAYWHYGYLMALRDMQSSIRKR